MKISVKNFKVTMELGNNGIELDVYSPDGKDYQGDIHIARGGVTWCKGKTQKANGMKVKWDDLIQFFETESQAQPKKKSFKKTK